jgi:hypothetical protein
LKNAKTFRSTQYKGQLEFEEGNKKERNKKMNDLNKGGR